MLPIYYFIFFIFIITFVIILLVWNSNIHKNPKYRSLLNLLAALTIMFSSFAIILQVYTFDASQTDDQIKIYEQMFNDLFEATTTYFEGNPKMNYYYSQMFHPLNYNPKEDIQNQRQYTEEQQITNLILQKLASIIYFLENDKTLTPEESSEIKEKLDRFISNIISSPIFLENYKNNIKKHFVSLTLSNYMQEHFNI
jgi:hypothetical protein